MSNVIKVVKGNSLPNVELTLTDKVTKAAVDLSDDTTQVFLRLRKRAPKNAMVSRIETSKVDGGSTGIITFNFSGGILDIDAGLYYLEIVIDYGGEPQALYDWLNVKVRDGLIS